MKKKLRIGFGRFMLESNSFSSVDSRFVDFNHYKEKEELLACCLHSRKWEVEGYGRNMELSGFMRAVRLYKKNNIWAVPLFSAWGVSGGPLAEEDFEFVCQKLRLALEEAGPLDGFYWALHGALDVRGIQEPEARLLQVAREVLGPNCPIAISLDMHALLTRPKVEAANIICGYKTNPHRDFATTGFNTGKLLIQSILKEIIPCTTWRSIPMLVGGGLGMDFLQPMSSILSQMRRMEKQAKVLSCSIFQCHPFLKHPNMGWGVYVITDNDPDLAEQIADEIAESCWSVKHINAPNFMESIQEVIPKIKKSWWRKLGTTTICDASDVVAAGGTGENTAILKALIEDAAPLRCYVPLRDPVAVEELWQKELNSQVEISVGGLLQSEVNEALTVNGRILIKKQSPHFGKTIVLQVQHVSLVLTEGAALALKPSFYGDLGLHPAKADITVVKSFIHYRLYYWLYNRKSYYVKTKGITDFDLFEQIKTLDPVYPNQEVDNWKKIDKKRRSTEVLV